MRDIMTCRDEHFRGVDGMCIYIYKYRIYLYRSWTNRGLARWNFAFVRIMACTERERERETL